MGKTEMCKREICKTEIGKRNNLKNCKLVKNLSCFTMVTILVLSLLVGLSGCGENTEEVPRVSKQVKLYFINEDFIETGDESKGALVEYDAISIYVPEKTPEGMTDEEVASNAYVDAVTHLWEVPDTLDDVDTIATEKFGIHNITGKDGTAYVDLIGEDIKGSGGSFEETLFISQIVETLINSFDEIERVQFLVDGEEVESLLGHCDTTEPFTEGFYNKNL